ncbi:hypothetical protein ACHAXR_009648 [Thalassiosira sp. AJA248-18]
MAQSIRGANGPMARSSPLHRRRNSRGLIAAGSGINRSNVVAGGLDAAAAHPRQGDEKNNTNAPGAGSSASSGGGVGDSIGSSGSSAPPTSASADAPSIPALPKPCYAGRLALACVQNAMEMGVITKFSLCPQGKARKSLVTKTKAARERKKKIKGGAAAGGGGAHDRAEETFLQNPPYRGTAAAGGNNTANNVEEEYSSGDDDDFDGSIEEENLTSSAQHIALDSRTKEPYFVPTGTDAASMGLQGQVPGMTSGKLPFNYRKVRYFDQVTASDRGVARQFLQQEIKNAKKLRSTALSNHLKKAQLRERERMAREFGEDAMMKSAEEDNDGGNNDMVDLKEEQTALATALSRFPHELTSTLSAALLIESLAMTHLESIEGMAKCYDGIVSAGTALLDLANDTMRDGSTTHGGKPKLTTSEIMGALAPLLITTLEQSSGEVFVALAKLRDFCGTRRYQRRFVQRIAPFLVRPPNAAMWCLRHQSDIEPIIAATEMILDNALEVFSSGWFERGRNMLKDTQRAEKLRSAASQLRCLNSPSPAEGGLLVGLSAPLRRVVGKKDVVPLSHDSLAEWEAEAIDKNIRQSILDVFSRDWSRISTLNLSPKESETPFSSRSRRGISTAKSKEWQETATAGAGGSGSSSQVSGFMPSPSLTKSPRSHHGKLPLSPRASANSSQMPSLDLLESTFGPSFSSQNVVIDDSERPISPTDYQVPPPTPLSPIRDPTKPGTPKTPPNHSHAHELSIPAFPDFQPSQHASPGRGVAPLSPSSSIGNTSSSSMSTLRSASTSQLTQTRDQYRALTSTAAGRKRTVAACRALRAQITQFEDAFIQMHGRPPKGAAERAPLASTYMQYREWKRAIRADAACRIQALCRGARVRLMLRRSEDQRISTFVAERSVGKPSPPKPPNHLSIPLDMGGEESDSALPRRLETRTGQRGDDSVEVVPVAPSVSPNWRNRQQQQPSNQQKQTGGGISPSSPRGQKSSSRSRSSLPDVSVMSLAELQQRKRELKQQLKLYDMNFHAQHGRMPEKREKEPIRHLYESYNAYKNQITVIEKGEAQPGPGTAAFRGSTEVPVADVSPKNVSPTFAGNTSPIQGNFKRSNSGGSSESVGASMLTPSEASSPQEEMSSSEVSSQDLASLKAEKATLHQMLRSYEKDFFKQHKRQVSSFADIRPVASQYRRYKEIKKAIAQKSSG